MCLCVSVFARVCVCVHVFLCLSMYVSVYVCVGDKNINGNWKTDFF